MSNDDRSSDTKRRRFENDVELTTAVTDGSIPAWHKFLDRYSGLIYAVVRRHFLTDDEDEIRSAYVDILEGFFDGGLAEYRGESRLSTWLIVTVRSRTIDLLRKRRGRIRAPRGYEALSALDKTIFQLFYVDRLPIEVVVHTLDWRGFSTSGDDIAEAIQRIENGIGRRYLRKLENEWQAKRHNLDSVRVLRYLIEQRLEFEEKQAATRADRSSMEAEALETTRRVRKAIGALTAEEKELLFLRFDRGLSARGIADRLNLKDQRRVYALINKVIGRIRKMLLSERD